MDKQTMQQVVDALNLCSHEVRYCVGSVEEETHTRGQTLLRRTFNLMLYVRGEWTKWFEVSAEQVIEALRANKLNIEHTLKALDDAAMAVVLKTDL